MKQIVFSIGIGSLALAVTAWGQPVNDAGTVTPRARPTAKVPARPVNTDPMLAARRYAPAASFQQRTYITPRINSNAMANQRAPMRTFREQNFSRSQDLRARK